MLVGVNEGLLPFKLGDDEAASGQAGGPMSEGILQRLQEERRLMYVGITRARPTLPPLELAHETAGRAVKRYCFGSYLCPSRAGKCPKFF
jgi:superfamily I DNA/RNA helicase